MCENPHQKSFTMMYKNGAFCNSCTNVLKTIKTKKRWLQLYGVENVSQRKHAKSPYKSKDYTFPCGTIIRVQGYEPFLLDILVKKGYTSDDIKTSRMDVPEIWYYKGKSKHRYFCDIYISRTNTIYEVKSTWTYEKDMEDIPLKKQACIESGYNFQLFVFDSKGTIKLLD